MADIPKIRFKGFTEPWEQRKLIDVCDYVDYRGKTPTKTDSGVFLVTAKNVKDGYIDYGVSQEYISEDDYEEVMHRGKPEIGDVLITTEAPCGNVAQVNRADIALAQRIIKYRGQSNIVDNTYLKDYLQSPEFQNILNAKSSGGTVKGIKGSILHQQEIKYPKYEEQFKIGSYFNNLDNLITLHQRKYSIIYNKLITWEQRKLGELAEIVGGGTPSTSVNSYWDGDIDWYAPAEIGEQIYLESSQLKITEEGLNKSSAKILPIGTVLFTSRAGIGKTAILQKEGCTNQGFQSIVPNKEKLDSYFIFTRSEELKRYGETVGAGSTFVEVSGKQMANMELMMPKTMPEQQQIGEFFANLDHLITLHQRKYSIIYNKLITWEQRKLGEVLKERTERAKGDEELLSVTIANGVIRQIDSEKRNTASEDRSNYKIVKKGDVPYNSMRMWQGAVGNSKYNGIVSPAYTILTPTPEANGKFFMELFKKKSTLQIFQRWSQGLTSDTWNLKYPILSSIQFAIPSVEEQEKIAEYFSSLDHLITLHQRKCDTLKELKKYMLQNMFPKKG